MGERYQAAWLLDFVETLQQRLKNEKPCRIRALNAALANNAKSRLRPLGGVDAGFVKREFFPSPVYGGRCPQGGRGDEVAKRRKCWIRQVAWLLGFVETLPATSQKRKTVLRCAMSFLPQMQKAGCARSAG